MLPARPVPIRVYGDSDFALLEAADRRIAISDIAGEQEIRQA